MNDKRQGHQSKAKHWLKVGAWIVGLALFLFVGLLFFTDWMQGKLERTVAKQSDGVYALQLYGLQVSPFAGAVSADSLKLIPDYKRWKELHSQKKEVANSLLDLRAQALDLRGLNFLKVLLGKNISLDRLAVQRPALLFTVMQQDTTQQPKPMHETVKGMIEGIHIGEIDVKGARLRYRKGAENPKTLLIAKAFDLTVDDFKLDSQSFQADNRAYYANRITLNTSGFKYLLPDGSYTLSSDSMQLDTEQRSLLVTQVKLTPAKSASDLARSKGKAVSYTKLTIPEISLNGLDYPAHSRDNNLLVKRVRIKKPDLYVFKDKQNFQNKGHKPLPHEMVQQLKMEFLIDSIEVSNGNIRYSELVPKATRRGRVSVQNLDISFRNVSNMARYTSDKKPTVVRAVGMIMGKVQMRLQVYMPLLNKNGYHRLIGEIQSGNPGILNPILGPTAFIRFDEGHINSGRFNIELTNRRATGDMHLLYQNLKIDILSKGSGTEQSFGKKVLSKLANWAIIKDSNPSDKGEAPRIGQINVTRDPVNSIFSYWTDCMMNGFMSSAGLGAKAEKL